MESRFRLIPHSWSGSEGVLFGAGDDFVLEIVAEVDEVAGLSTQGR